MIINKARKNTWFKNGSFQKSLLRATYVTIYNCTNMYAHFEHPSWVCAKQSSRWSATMLHFLTLKIPRNRHMIRDNDCRHRIRENIKGFDELFLDVTAMFHTYDNSVSTAQGWRPGYINITHSLPLTTPTYMHAIIISSNLVRHTQKRITTRTIRTV